MRFRLKTRRIIVKEVSSPVFHETLLQWRKARVGCPPAENVAIEPSMPKIYRAMRKADDGKPSVEATGKGLGARGEPVNGVVDINLDAESKVILNGKGMSVAPSWRDLPFFLIPKRLKEKFPGARGSSALYCFTLGEGPFTNGPVAKGLDLKIDAPKHGVVVPRVSVALDQYQTDLAKTRDRWIVDEA